MHFSVVWALATFLVHKMWYRLHALFLGVARRQLPPCTTNERRHFLALSKHNPIFSLANENNLNNTPLFINSWFTGPYWAGLVLTIHIALSSTCKTTTAFLHLCVSFTQTGVDGSSNQGQPREHRRVDKWTSASPFGELHRERFWEDDSKSKMVQSKAEISLQVRLLHLLSSKFRQYRIKLDRPNRCKSVCQEGVVIWPQDWWLVLHRNTWWHICYS